MKTNQNNFLLVVIFILSVIGNSCTQNPKKNSAGPRDDINNNSIANNDYFNSLIIYQVMVEAYQDGDHNCDYNTGYGPSDHKGDLKGIINALPYIKSIGINAIWLTPIFDSDGNSKLDATGYFCKDYFKIDPKFGTLQDAKNLVNKAHELGLYVFFDGVFGHHKQGVVPSPKGNMPAGPDNPVSYPGSLEFYKEVATFWIDELEIDGWRLDQCYQVSLRNQDKNYWKDIREAVEAKCNERKKSGKKWGVLGYMVGEDWESAQNIQLNSYSEDGLQSAFDFPSRYDIVQVLACDADRKTIDEGAESFTRVFSTPSQKGYSHRNGIYPNLFIGNHDFVRFGNLINWKYGLNRSDEDYWKRHKCAISLLAAYTGPITVYYGDEYGDMLDGYTGQRSLGFANDHVGRSTGKISDFTRSEQDLVNYTAKILNIRSDNPALCNGTRTNLKANKVMYVDYKVNGDNKIVYIINVGENENTCIIDQDIVRGKKLLNFENNTDISASSGKYNITIPGLTAGFYLVSE